MIKTIAFAVACVVSILGMSTPGHALFHTYVSGTGGGAVCSRAAPCADFQTAVNATDYKGTVTCLDQGAAFQTLSLTINNSITIDCAGVSVVSFNVVINGAGVAVTLRNLTIGGSANIVTGIDFQNGAALMVENCVVENWEGTAGINFAPPAGVTAKLHIKDSVIKNNGRAASGGGVIIQPSGSGSAKVVIERTTIENNTYGFFANGTGSTGNIIVHIKDSVISSSKFGGVSAYTAAGQSVVSLTMDRSSSLLNGADGILAQSPNAYVLLASSTVLSNVTGLHSVSGGNILSYQDNHISGNVSDGAPTGVLTVK